jgi:DedD protein
VIRRRAASYNLRVERPLKERLVGAIVLMAAGIILIPEMLAGPDRAKSAGTPEPARPTARGDAPIKTYTIDLNQPPSARAVVTRDDNRVPPPEDVPAALAAPTQTPTQTQAEVQPGAESREGAPPQPQPEAQVKPEPVVSQPTTPAPTVVELPTRTAPAAPARPLASGAAVPTSGAWAVQLGSFSKQSTAERLVSELRGKGHDAFVMPVKSGATTLYRVRIGPLKDRSSAERTLHAVQSLAPGAAIVAHP